MNSVDLETAIVAGAGILLSLLFRYVPKLREAYEAKDEAVKQLIMLGLLAVTSLVIFALGCLGVAKEIGLAITCDKAGALLLFKYLVVSVVANQTTALITPKTKSAREISVEKKRSMYSG